MKKVMSLLVMDVDGTLIRQEGIDLLAQKLAWESVAEITAQAMNGELDFAASLEARVALLKGLETSIFPRILEQIISGAESNHGTASKFTRLALFRGFHEVIDPIARSWELI